MKRKVWHSVNSKDHPWEKTGSKTSYLMYKTVHLKQDRLGSKYQFNVLFQEDFEQ